MKQSKRPHRLAWLIPALTACLVAIATGAGPKVKIINPDFTKGDVVPEEANHIADDFSKGEPDFPKTHSLRKAVSIREAVGMIEGFNENPKLIRIQ